MSDPDAALAHAQLLRNEATALLNDAAQCDEPARRDELVSEALALLAQARKLRSQAECALQMPGGRDAGPGPSSTRMQ